MSSSSPKIDGTKANVSLDRGCFTTSGRKQQSGHANSTFNTTPNSVVSLRASA
ncbi:Unknown protein sequence [Pseudomonas amygdali pv. lachrymans]|uniref:Uncharacterized protein n=1 Tax=Pseudomonas amygdali pv. lachrymans TaxID=53707 RepID=A0ABR5KYT1_PSEAV|nr:Unknown protein sequence [Pseudomonas amygdali pv. lachrymans]